MSSGLNSVQGPRAQRGDVSVVMDALCGASTLLFSLRTSL